MSTGVYTGWFLAPAVALYTVLFVVPVVMGLGYSLTNWNSMSDTVKFIGLANFQEIFTPNSPYLKSLYITLVFTLFTIVTKGGIGLALALLVNARHPQQERAARRLFSAADPLAADYRHRVRLGAESGGQSSTRLCARLGLDGLTRNWLVDPNLVLASTIGVESWRMIGWNMVILLAGLQTIPLDYYEAASLDGASYWMQLRKITLPLLVPALTITTVLNTIHGLKTFDLIFALTGGGPGSLTEVLNIAVFHEFSIGRYGMATALGVVIFAITAIIALSIKNAMLRNVVEA